MANKGKKYQFGFLEKGNTGNLLGNRVWKYFSTSNDITLSCCPFYLMIFRETVKFWNGIKQQFEQTYETAGTYI